MKALNFILLTLAILFQTVNSQNISPEQLEQLKSKAKEMGMSEPQIQQQTKNAPFDVNRFLRGDYETATSSANDKLLDTNVISTKKEVETIATPKLVIPGFTKRIDSTLTIEPFGYNIFKQKDNIFKQTINLPTPLNYQVGPGDEILLTMWGEAQAFYQFIVNRDGQIIIPTVGPVVAQGVTVETLHKRLLSIMTPYYSGLKNGGAGANTFLDVSLGKLRTIQVFVLGEVTNPGGYIVPSMSTSFYGIFIANGPSLNGSLRNINVVRGGKNIANLDMYDFLLSGDKTNDVRLQDGDIIFVNRVGARVAVVGNVLRPAIYELLDKKTLGEVVSLSGGFLFDTYFDRIHIERIIPFEERTNFSKDILDLDYRFNSVKELLKSDVKLFDGDIVTVRSISNLLENRIVVSGNVNKPGVQELKKGMKVYDAILQADSVLANTFMERASLVRTLANGRQKTIPLNLTNVINKDSEHNILLESLDSIIVYDNQYFFPQFTVEIGGAVRKPGVFRRYENMSVTDLIVYAGGLTEEASYNRIYIANKDTTSIGKFSKSKFINLSKNYWQSDKKNTNYLEDYDYVYVPFDPKIVKPRYVTINGEVFYPGQYVLENENEKISSLIKRAGGLKPNAYLEGSRLDRTLRGAGLINVDFAQALENDGNSEDVKLEEGDIITIERDPKIVFIKGEVVSPFAAKYESGRSLNYYLNQAGGVSENGDAERIVVTLPNGKKWEQGWIFNDEITSGSVIYVPSKLKEEESVLPIMRDWSTIIVSMVTMLIGIMQVTK